MRTKILSGIPIFLFVITVAIQYKTASVFASCNPTLTCLGGTIPGISVRVNGLDATVSIQGAPPPVNGTLCAIIDPNYRTGQALKSQDIFVDQNGNGSVTFGFNATGTHQVFIYPDENFNLVDFCGGPVEFELTGGPSPTPTPSPSSPDCRDEGDSCVPDVTEVCYPDRHYCDGSDRGGIVKCIHPDCVAPTTTPAPTPRKSTSLPGRHIGGSPRCKPEVPGQACRDSCLAGERTVEETPELVECGKVGKTCCVPSNVCFDNETYVSTLNACFSAGGFINTTLEWLLIAAALLALFRLTVGGILYIFSQGQPDKLEAAQQTITSAIFGLILVFIAWLLIQFVGENTPSWWKVDFFSIGS